MYSSDLEKTSLQYAKYLDNMIRRTPENKYKDVPTEHLTDYFPYGELPHIEDGISVIDIVFGPVLYNDEACCDIGRGFDGYFGYTKSHTKEVIVLALAYRFLDMKLPYKEISMTIKSGHNGLYASEINRIMDEYKHLEYTLDLCTEIEYDYENDFEISFYELNFCGHDLGKFKDEFEYCSTYEEYICELLLSGLESKYKSFTIFSTPYNVFNVCKVNSESIY